jgi:hypothetical protein
MTLMESDNTGQKFRLHNFRFLLIDACVILFCVSGAVFSLYMFNVNMYQSSASINKKQMGIVEYKSNNVQRRFSDSFLWSRLSVKSPIYLDDTVRVAENSSAELYIKENNNTIILKANTIIRINYSVFDLDSGTIIITNRGINGKEYTINGNLIMLDAGSTLISTSKNGVTTIQIINSASITDKDGRKHNFEKGGNLTPGAKDIEQKPSAVVTQPRPDARFIKTGDEPLNIRFAWDTDPQQPLRLEIAADLNFTRSTKTFEGVVDSASADLVAGKWHWRLSHQDTVLGAGQFTIVDAAVSALVSPIQNILYRYWGNPPSIRFEWRPVGSASYYEFEAGLTPDLLKPITAEKTEVASFVKTGMQEGTWYWRVKPVFSNLYENKDSSVFSPVSSFSIEKIIRPESEKESRVIPVLPAPPSKPVPESVSAPAPASASASASAPAPKPVTPPPVLLPGARNLRPVAGQRFTIDDLRTKRQIDFSWSPVEGANAYIFTLYHQSGAARRRIIQTEPPNKTEWTLRNLSILEQGKETYVWEVEAVNKNSNGGIVRHGRKSESSFIIDIPPLSKPEIKDIEESP